MTVQGGRSSSWRRPSWTGQGLGGHAFAKATLERLPRCSRQGRFRVGASHRSQIDQGLPGRCNPDRHAAQPRLAGAVGPGVLELQVHLGQRLLHGLDGAVRGIPPSAALLLPRRRITFMQNKHATGSQPREAIAASRWALAGTAAMSGVISSLHLTGASSCSRSMTGFCQVVACQLLLVS